MQKKKILIINGSYNGDAGQSALIAQKITSELAKHCEYKTLVLKDSRNMDEWHKLTSWAEGFIFLTGTYWDSWGSPLQSFLEQTTEWETSSRWLGKPAAVIVTMHSVGGKSVLSRLQGVLSTLGLNLPPLSGLVFSLTTHLLQTNKSDHGDDFWDLGEINHLVHNLNVQIELNQKLKPNWSSWKVDRSDVKRTWLSPKDFTLKDIDQTLLQND
ncbi:MAG: hypothetical protein CME71_06980 [Halobacteriovorax sp.]|nr:hypothetical protein [Halobacteriovorax sp.]